MALRVGFSGYGAAGRYLHAPLVAAAGMEVAAVATSRGAEVAADFPQAAVVSDFEALLARPDIDLVVIVTPNVLHVPQVRAALTAGRHVVVDKPATPTRAEAEQLAALASEKGLKLAVYHNRRWDSDFLTARRLLESGELGEIAALRLVWDRFRPQVLDRWRDRPAPASGNLYDLGSHLIDQALQLVGMPDWLQADVFTQRQGGATDDGFELLMGLGRMRLSLGVSLISAAPRDRFRIEGTAGLFRKQGLDVQEDQLKAGMAPLDPQFGREPEAQQGEIVAPDGSRRAVPCERGRWLTFYERMRQAIESDGEVPVTMASAAKVIGLIEAAHASARLGRRIALDPDGRWA
ncbi:Gfo/Idh/MocA family oxidoreductase [Stappia indica]|uniref:Scyllo-inositol 2-dehydrogenase (NADP+) n=1 Tax=Stappia indica TaxID=538381 RepID=A0A285SMM8_9HYPH|nr:Gfo/Idh/MocA family oxidoreductase [Stappia indica]SOC07248.1 scyllo-inositol 2-dehydrogenase (NADP+) [Stappia indica]